MQLDVYKRQALQAQIHSLEEQERALLEKRNRIADVRWEVRNVLGILEDAAGYGRWDAGRGSLLSSYLKQERVQTFFAEEELLIGQDYWNFVCQDPDGFEVFFTQYQKSCEFLKETLKEIKDLYFNP